MKTAFSLAVLAGIILLLRRKAKGADKLDTTLFAFPDGTPYKLRSLMQSVLCIGAAGSGKTTGPGRHFLKAALSVPSGGLILFSKPEEVEAAQKIFAETNRSSDLLLFGPKHPLRLNTMKAIKGDAQDKTHMLMMVSETLKRGESGSGGGDNKFWEQAKERWTLLSITALMLAGEEVSGPNIQRFIVGVANQPEEMKSPEWQAGFTSTTLGRAFSAVAAEEDVQAKRIKQGDLEQVETLFLKEAPRMSDKTRSNIVAECQGMLAAANTGISRELLGGETNIELSVVRENKWIGVDMSTKEYGDSGRYVLTALKYLFQRDVLAYHAGPESIPVLLYSDEYQAVLNTYDMTYLSECRSHMGGMIALTQSIHAIYATMKGDHDHSSAEALITNFGTKVITTVGDPKTATWAADLIGKDYETDDRYTPKDDLPLYDLLRGASSVSVTTGTRLEYKVQPERFMRGMRQGGPPSWLVDACVIRSGDTFRSNERYLFTSFKQR